MKDTYSNLPINKWAEQDRPREKMLAKGASSLSDAELLAILIGSGNSKESAVQLSQRILHSVGNNLNRLGKLSTKDLSSSFKGIGEAKAVTIAAALELGKRRNMSEVIQQDSIRCSRDAFILLHPHLSDLQHEEVWAIFLNRGGKIISKQCISQGGVNATIADVRIILKAAVESLASGIILLHNHPSGNMKASEQDDFLTQKLKKAAELLDINLFDHIIIADNQYYSYADEGRI